MSGAALAKAALDLAGTRFRLHGRNPASGLDCIGLLEAALMQIGRPARLPQGYRLRLASLERWLPDPGVLGFANSEGAIEPGDVLLLTPSPGQFHLAIAISEGRCVHANAGLRRVVEAPELPEAEVLHHWRLLPE